MAAGTGLISTFYTGARAGDDRAPGHGHRAGRVLFLFAGGLLAQQRWSLPFALYLCAWALLALVHFCVPVTAVAAPTFAASTAAPASATPTVSTAPRHGGPTAAAAAMPAQVKTAFAAALLSMVAFFAGIIMLPARLAGLGVDEAGTGYFLSFISLVAVGGAALLPALGRRASGAPCWSPRCWPTRPPTAVSPWRSRPRNGRRCWRAPCCMDWDSACRFRCSTTWSSNIAPTARGPSSGVPVHGHLLRPVPVFLHGIPARRAGVVFAGAGLISLLSAAAFARDGPPAPLPVTTEDTRAMELSQASLLLDPAPCNWKPALNGCPTACCTWPAAPICTTARARCSNGGSARVPARASTSGGTRGPRVQRLGRRQRRYARGFDPSGEGVLHRHARRRPAIQFRDAAEFFGAEAYRAARDSGAISAAVCGRVGMGATPQRLPTGEVLGGRLLHIGRDTKWGWRCAAISTWARTGRRWLDAGPAQG